MKIKKVDNLEDGIYKIMSGKKVDWMVHTLLGVVGLGDIFTDKGIHKINSEYVEFYIEVIDGV